MYKHFSREQNSPFLVILVIFIRSYNTSQPVSVNLIVIFCHTELPFNVLVHDHSDLDISILLPVLYSTFSRPLNFFRSLTNIL